MSRWALMLGTGALVACQARPEREDPLAFPSALDDTAALPLPNDCTTQTHPFSIRGTGYVRDEVDGYAIYEYKSNPDQRTSIVMRGCRAGELPDIFTLNYYGAGRVRKGTYDVKRLAKEEGEFEFGYVFEDALGGAALNCSDQATGSVTITKSNFSRVEGRFDIQVRCFDYTILDERMRPQDARFVGTFSANNVGQE